MSNDKDPFGIREFIQKIMNKDPEATALLERAKRENASYQAGYKAGDRAAFQKFPWPFVMLGGFVAWIAAGVWLVTQYPILLPLALGATVLWFTWMRKGWKPGAIVAAVILAALGGLYYYESIPPDHETQRMQIYRRDSTYCSKFATKREEARKLLAWEWPTGSFEERMKQESVRLNLSNLDSELAGNWARHEADYEACMLGQDWTKESLVELAAREKARLEECKRRGTLPWQVCG